VEISKIQVPYVVKAKAFLRATKKRTMFVIYDTPITKSINGPQALPIRYKVYQDVFEKKNADMVPQHHLYDCTIDLL
jgi:hypothetical protein